MISEVIPTMDIARRRGRRGNPLSAVAYSVRGLPRFARSLRLRCARNVLECGGILRLFLMTLLALVHLPGYAQTVTGLQCGPFRQVGRFTAPEITECSGMVVSRKNPGLLWVHNDSGDSARLFAVREDGSLRGIYHLSEADAVDWEDMALGPCSDKGRECLYVADIGNNKRQRPQVQVYRVQEPSVPLDGPPVLATLQDTERFDCAYPDAPHDAETLLVDPVAGTPYVVTKEPKGRPAVVFRFPGKLDSGQTVTLEKVCTLPALSSVTGGDAARDGSLIALRDYLSAYLYPRPGRTSFSMAFNASPLRVPLGPEEQGESIALAPCGNKIYTASEGPQGPIHKACCTTTRVSERTPDPASQGVSSREP